MIEAVHQPAPKTDRLRRLEESALLLFSRRGYDGTSLRDIADAAGVSLSLIDRHFGNKAELFDEIHMRVWRTLNAERRALLNRSKGAAGCTLRLEEIVEAFVRPVVSRALSSPQGRAAIQLVREARTRMFHCNLGHSAERNAVREIWIEAIITARPGCTRSSAVWAFALTVNALYSNQLLERWLDHLIPNAPKPDVDDVTRRIVAFCTAGVDALAQLDRNANQTQASSLCA